MDARLRTSHLYNHFDSWIFILAYCGTRILSILAQYDKSSPAIPYWVIKTAGSKAYRGKNLGSILIMYVYFLSVLFHTDRPRPYDHYIFSLLPIACFAARRHYAGRSEPKPYLYSLRRVLTEIALHP